MNDRAVAALGRIYKKNLGAKEKWEVYAEKLSDGKNFLISPIFRVVNDGISLDVEYAGCDLTEYDSSSYKRYAYKKGSSRGGDITITTKLGSADDEVLRKKIDVVLNTVFINVLETAKTNHISDKDLTDEINLFTKIQLCWSNNQSAIKEGIKIEFESLDKDSKTRGALSLVVQIDGVNKTLSEFDIFRNSIYYDGTFGLSLSNGNFSEGENAVCSICFEQKPKLHGFASPFKYYTLDKPGYIANYFNVKLAWKNYPICSDCAQELYLGEKAIRERFKWYFYGRGYWAVPRLIIDDESLQEKLYTLFDARPQSSESISNEDEIMRYIASQSNFFNLDLIFFEENPTTKAIKLKAHIEELLPSRFKKIFLTVPDIVNNNEVFTKYLLFKTQAKKGESEIKKYSFIFRDVLDFFDREDYTIIQDVFDGNKIDRSVLYKRFMLSIYENYSKEQSGSMHKAQRNIIRSSIGVTLFLHELGIIEKSNFSYEVKMTQDKTNEKRGILEIMQEFVASAPEVFDAQYKVGIFALGVLVKLVMNIQYRALKNTPFEKKLKGFHLTAKDVKNIYVDSISKLTEYDGAKYYPQLLRYLSEVLLREEKNIAKASASEISYFFVSGIQLAATFKPESSEGETNE